MATDREGNTINVGDRVVLVPKIASASGQDLVLGNRDPMKVKGEDVLIESELGGGGGGVTDHGALTGLGDADHPAGAIAFTTTDVLAGRATAGAGAGEEIPCTAAGRALLDDADAGAQRVTLGLGTAAVEPSSSFAAASHTHVAADVTDLGNSATRDVGTGSGDVAAGDHTHALDDLSDVTITTPSTGDQIRWSGSQWVNFTPLAPPVYLQQANNLSDLLSASTARTNLGLGSAAVLASSDVLQVANDLSDLNDPATARTNLELGTAAEEDIATFALAGHTHATEFRWLRQQEGATWLLNNTGWSNSSSGSGGGGLAQGRTWAGMRDNTMLMAQRVTTGTATSGTNAGVRRSSSTDNLYMPDGRITVVKLFVVNLSEAETIRVGFFGNNALPSATPRPSAGLFIEYDVATSANWYLVTTDGAGGAASADSGIAASSGSWSTFAIEFVSGSSVKLYTVSTSGAATEVAEVTTNIMSSDTHRSGGMFGQVVKTDPASSASGTVLFDAFPVYEPEVVVLP